MAAQKPTIVFFHAFPLSGQMWKEQVSFLSGDYNCITPDLPGFGKSILPDHPVTFEFYVDEMLKFIETNKIQKSIWCGLSMGGYLAMRLYERAPEKCSGLILCDTKAGADGNEAKLKRWASIQALKKNRDEFINAQFNALVGESSKSNSQLKSTIDNLIKENQDKGIASGLIGLATRTDNTPGLAKITVPTLIVVGDEDKVTPVSEAEVMNKAIAGSKLKVLNKTGHLSNLENPKEFNAVIAEFLNELGSLIGSLKR